MRRREAYAFGLGLRWSAALVSDPAPVRYVTISGHYRSTRRVALTVGVRAFFLRLRWNAAAGW
jgi:hypothetical protein